MEEKVRHKKRTEDRGAIYICSYVASLKNHFASRFKSARYCPKALVHVTSFDV